MAQTRKEYWSEVRSVYKDPKDYVYKELKVIHVDLRGSGLAEEDGMVCGGIIDVLLEYIE